MSNPNIIRWVKLDSQTFNNLQVKLPNVMYLLEDTRELYNGEDNLTSDLYFVNSLPVNPIKNKFYVTQNMQCRLWTGLEWKTIIPEIMNSLQDGVNSPGLVTGNAIKQYVTKKIEDASGGIGGGSELLNTDAVTLSKTIQVEGTEVGNYQSGDTIQKGTSLTTILQNIFCKLIPPTYTMPQLSIRPGSQEYEIGSFIDPIISAVYTPNDGGEISSYVLTQTINGITSTLVNGVVIENYQMPYLKLLTPVQLTASINYTAGIVKPDNLGNPYPQGSIPNGSLTSTMYLYPKRSMFYGALTKPSSMLNSSDIRQLPNNFLNPQPGQTISIDIEAGVEQIVIAMPSNLSISSITSKVLNMSVLNTFIKTSIDVGGVHNILPVPYNVYIYSPAVPFVSSDVYTLSIQ